MNKKNLQNQFCRFHVIKKAILIRDDFILKNYMAQSVTGNIPFAPVPKGTVNNN